MVAITVHHLEQSRSHRILWLLEELALPYEVARYARDRTTLRAPAELRQLHPLGKSPVVTVKDSPLASGSGDRSAAELPRSRARRDAVSPGE